MPKLPQISGQKLIKLLLKDSWEEVSQKGSHVKMRRNKSMVIVPQHKILKKGTLSGILKDSGLKLRK